MALADQPAVMRREVDVRVEIDQLGRQVLIKHLRREPGPHPAPSSLSKGATIRYSPVVTGDVTQVDLPVGRASGLAEARQLLDGVEGIAFCHFSDVDVVRHPLVQKIIVRYEARDKERAP